MFISNDSIKFMIAKIFFNLAEFKYYSIKNTISYNYHGKDTIEINYVISGNGKIKINDEIYEIGPNYYFVIPEFVSYTIIATEELNIYSFYLLIDKKSGYDEYISLIKKYYINKDNHNIDELFKTIHSELITKTLGYNEIVTSSFKMILVKLCRNEGLKGNRLSHWPLESLQFNIDKIFSNEFNTITIVDLADRLNMSVRDLQRYLLKNYNKNFSELKKDFKLEYAKIRLTYFDDSIEKISEDLNFSSREHFCYFFKKETNLSPLSYRKKQKMD
jgi:AraC-like DNA-binding protein